MLDSRRQTAAAQLILASAGGGFGAVSCVCSLSSCSGSLTLLPSLPVAGQAGSLVTDLQGSHLPTVLAIHPLFRQILQEGISREGGGAYVGSLL